MPVKLRPTLVVAIVAFVGRTGLAQCTPAVQRLVDERKFDEARGQIQSALSRTPNDDQVIHCLGTLSMAMDRPRSAVSSFEQAIKLNDKSSAHHVWLGDALGSIADSTSKLKQPFLARRIKSEFERAVELDPRNIQARHGLIQFYTLAPRVMGGSMDKAREQAREIGKVNVVRGHFEMATILFDDKKGGEAEAEYVAAVTEAPDSAVAYRALGAFYQGRQRWPDAFATYDKLLARFPSDPMAPFQIGRTAALSGQLLDRGEAALVAWIANPPKNAATATLAAAHQLLGMILEKQGKKELARSEYNQALAINPNSRAAKESLAALK
jgi:tetratricopeptide (TPR) repeat protein